MKILYISHLPETMSGGPKYSVPNQIANQSRFDDVFWINMTKVEMIECSIKPTIIEKTREVIQRILDISPSLVVFEEFYYPSFCKIASKLHRLSIPYIIVPRSSMTSYAQSKKTFKKRVGNLLLFNKFVRNSLAIEFLTKNEKESTISKWKKKKSVVIPNGTEPYHELQKRTFSNKVLKGVFIGRIDTFHKGIDVFLEACSHIDREKFTNRIQISFYGPIDKEDRLLIEDKIVRSNLSSNIFVFGEIHGNEKARELLASDFFVLTSRFEGMPMGLLEALSYGLPSIVTYGTNMGEEIISYGAGFCSSCDCNGIMNNLLKIMELSEEDLMEMSENAKKLAGEYKWEEIAKKTHDCYDLLLK